MTNRLQTKHGLHTALEDSVAPFVILLGFKLCRTLTFHKITKFTNIVAVCKLSVGPNTSEGNSFFDEWTVAHPLSPVSVFANPFDTRLQVAFLMYG